MRTHLRLVSSEVTAASFTVFQVLRHCFPHLKRSLDLFLPSLIEIYSLIWCLFGRTFSSACFKSFFQINFRVVSMVSQLGVSYKSRPTCSFGELALQENLKTQKNIRLIFQLLYNLLVSTRIVFISCSIDVSFVLTHRFIKKMMVQD